MTFVKVVALISVMFLVFAFLLYTPLPEAVEEPTLYRIHGLVNDLFQTVSYVYGKLTGVAPVAVQRQMLTRSMPAVYQNFPELEVEDLKFEGVPVRVYKRKSVVAVAPCVIYMHGGGWVMHNIDTLDATCVNLALKTSMIVVSIDYRLAPENPYPAPLDDCLKATKYLLQNGQQHGINVNRVAVIGGSSGGNLATAVALRLAEEDSDSMPPLKLQVLINPVTQLLNFRTSSYLLYKNYLTVNQRDMVVFAASYLLQNFSSEVLQAMEQNHHITSFVRRPIYSNLFKEEYLPDYVRQNTVKETVDPFDDRVNEELAQKLDSLVVDPFVSPLMAENFTKLPPTYVVVSEFDVLRDDGLFYVHHLRQAGVKVELAFQRGQVHDFMLILAPGSLFQYKGAVPQWEKIYSYLMKNL